jgi:hypothetical protein
MAGANPLGLRPFSMRLTDSVIAGDNRRTAVFCRFKHECLRDRGRFYLFGKEQSRRPIGTMLRFLRRRRRTKALVRLKHSCFESVSQPIRQGMQIHRESVRVFFRYPHRNGRGFGVDNRVIDFPIFGPDREGKPFPIQREFGVYAFLVAARVQPDPSACRLEIDSVQGMNAVAGVGRVPQRQPLATDARRDSFRARQRGQQIGLCPQMPTFSRKTCEAFAVTLRA